MQQKETTAILISEKKNKIKVKRTMSDKKIEGLKRGICIVETNSSLKVYGILSLYAPDDV